MDFLQGLNEVQRNAVMTTEGPVLVIAGPGSGKTRVLTFRIAWLLKNNVPPDEILTLTFTNKAAKEMKERISHEVGGNAAHRVWAGTFHSVFARILRTEATKIGYPSNFTVYDTDDSSSLLRAIIKEMQLDAQMYNVSAIRSRISLAKSNLMTPQLYRSNEQWMAEDRQQRRPMIADIYEKYMQRCKLSGAMDFDDLLLQLFRLFRDNPDDVVEKYRKKFKYIHVDEFQDTNFLQYAILRRLVKYEGSTENLFAVGDDAQSIYAFRGATIDNIIDFEKDYPNLQVFKLEQNYRSTHHIVAAANEVITYNRKQLQKTIWTDKEERNKIKLIKCLTDDEEARRVADSILEQKNRHHLHNNEIAILYRTNAQSRKFEEALRRQNLNYKVYGGTSFYQRKEVKDLIAYLRLAVNSQDEEALRRVINFPTRGISDATVDKISRFAGEHNIAAWSAMLHVTDITDKAKKSLAGFRALIEKWQKRLNTDNALQLATDILRQSGLLDNLKADTTPEGISRLENVMSVLDAIAEFVSGENNAAVIAGEDETGKSLAAYLQTVTLLTDADNNSDETDNITLMSVHSAKGLEFKSVFVTGMEEQLFPSFMSIEDPNGLDEERRLFYVAITRAKDLLTLTHCKTRYRYGQLRESKPSRFLEEIDIQHYDIGGGFGSLRQHDNTSNEQFATGARVSGIPARRNNGPLKPPLSADEQANFAPSPAEMIVAGAKVMHLKFGKGEVVKVEGPRDGKMATIRFEGDEAPQRLIALKFAKLQIL